ncbi:MAG TPA: hypothetical protein VHK01_05615, partial [Lacipirellulaceae bacterium]|nr:hypothetical protein [Lacipirellulaceae bacterium]
RFYASIIQAFSDEFAGVPQQANYDLFLWNGSAYVFSESVRQGGADFTPNLDLKPYHMDEFTIGFERQFGRSMGAGVRFISREWGNLIDDIRTFRPNGSINRDVINYDEAERQYRGIQFTLDRRFANRWFAQGSYTYSRTEGNHFQQNFSPLGDYLDAECLTTSDLSVGANGRVPCATVNNGPNTNGRPSYDRPHNIKVNGGYSAPIGPFNLTVSAVSEIISKQRYTRSRTVTVLRPGTNNSSGQTASYLYEELGSSPVEGLRNFIDFGTELTWQIANTHQAGFKAEIFNLTDNQEQIQSNNTAWCDATANATCTTAVNNFGKASARGAFQLPRQYRFSLIYRF